MSVVEACQRGLFRVLTVAGSGRGLWDLLEATGIVVFVGPNGSGKSFAAVAAVLPVLAGKGWVCDDLDHVHHAPARAHVAGCEHCATIAPSLLRADPDEWSTWLCAEGATAFAEGRSGERLVFSTVELLDDVGDSHALYRPLVDYRQLLVVEHADVLFDEVAGVSDSSDSSAIPVQVVQWLHTLRKRDVRLRVTTPAYARCSKPIRQVAQVVVDCRSFFPAPASPGRLWRPRRMLRAVGYDAFAFEDFTAGGKERLSVLARALLWVPTHEAGRRYSTLGQVLALGHTTEAGLCSACGGARSRPRCACPAEHDLDVEFEVVERVSSSGSRVREALPKRR